MITQTSTGKISLYELETKVLDFLFSHAGKETSRDKILSGVDDLIKTHGWDPQDFRAKKVIISGLTSCQNDSDC